MVRRWRLPRLGQKALRLELLGAALLRTAEVVLSSREETAGLQAQESAQEVVAVQRVPREMGA